MATENDFDPNGSDVYITDKELVIEKAEYEQLLSISEDYKYLDLENNVLVNREQFAQLLAQTAEYKVDILELVNVFQAFAGLFSGGGVMSAVPVITKLMKDKTQMAKLSGVVTVIDKYTVKNSENNG